MNTLQQLQEHCSRLQAQVTALQATLDELRAQSDPFAAHVFAARRRYRDTELHDTKSGKRTEREAWESYGRATRLGFRGSLHEWMRILHARPTPPE